MNNISEYHVYTTHRLDAVNAKWAVTYPSIRLSNSYNKIYSIQLFDTKEAAWKYCEDDMMTQNMIIPANYQYNITFKMIRYDIILEMYKTLHDYGSHPMDWNCLVSWDDIAKLYSCWIGMNKLESSIQLKLIYSDYL